MNTDHVVTNGFTKCMECRHCGFQQALKMPDTIDAILAKMDAFIEYHKACKAPIAEAVMSDYIKGFNDGYDYVLNEIEVFIKTHEEDPRFIGPIEILLAKLKGRETT
jgi:hypothetical protein